MSPSLVWQYMIFRLLALVFGLLVNEATHGQKGQGQRVFATLRPIVQTHLVTFRPAHERVCSSVASLLLSSCAASGPLRRQE
jgi:hypothetical protein